MEGPSKTKDDTQLPKIRSQQRIRTANDRRITEDDKALANRPLSNNCRTRSLRAFTTKTVKYESAGNIYNKKIQDIEKQTLLVDCQIRDVEDQIKLNRQTIGISKKQPGMSRLNESSVSYFSKISMRKNIQPDHDIVKSELKNLQAKILNFRNKIDVHLEKNKAIEQQIDAYRKEISTLKNINAQLQSSFKQTSHKYDEQMELSKKLDVQIGQKTQLTHRKKVQNMHQKAQMIKQYDVILKTLDKQLNNQQTPNEEEKTQFYLTDIDNPQIEIQKINKVTEKPLRQIISGKKPKIHQIREKLKNYEKQFQQLKMKVGSQNIEQITKKFTEQYQKNFNQYNFINEIYQEYQEANHEQFELLQKKNQLLKQLQAERSSCKVQEIHSFKDNIKKMNGKKEKIRNDMLMYNKLALQLKVYLGQYLSSMQKNQKCVNPLFQDLTDKTVASRLHQIYQKNSKELGYSQRNKDKKLSKNYLSVNKESIEDLIEEAKKQSQVLKDNRLLTREEFQKNTIEMKQKKMQSSNFNSQAARFKTKKEIERARIQNLKKVSR